MDLGGRKRCHALSLAVATCTTLPVALYHAAVSCVWGSAALQVSRVASCLFRVGVAAQTWTGPTNGYSTYSIGVTLAAATMGLFTVVRFGLLCVTLCGQLIIAVTAQVLGEYMHGVVAAKLRQPLAANVRSLPLLLCGVIHWQN